MLNKSGESGHPCFFPDLRGKAFSYSPLSMMLAVGLSHMGFVMLSYISSISVVPSLLAPVSWKTIFPRNGKGDGSGGNASDGERWGAADEASLSCLQLTSCCAARFLTG